MENIILCINSNFVNKNNFIYRRNKTDIDTSEYASNVPIDIISTNLYKSNNNAINAIKDEYNKHK